MKFQNPSIHHSKVNTHTDRQTDTQTDKPKAICPSNFFKVGGIKNLILDALLIVYMYGQAFSRQTQLH